MDIKLYDDKIKEADELIMRLVPLVSAASHDAFLHLDTAVAQSRDARIRALQTAGSPTRKLRVTNGNGASELQEQG